MASETDFLTPRQCPLNLISGLDKLTEVDAVAWTLRWVFFTFRFLFSSLKVHWKNQFESTSIYGKFVLRKLNIFF